MLDMILQTVQKFECPIGQQQRRHTTLRHEPIKAMGQGGQMKITSARQELVCPIVQYRSDAAASNKS